MSMQITHRILRIAPLLITSIVISLFGLFGSTAPIENRATATIGGPAIIRGTPESTEILRFPYAVVVQSQAEGWSNRAFWWFRVWDGKDRVVRYYAVELGGPLEVGNPNTGILTPFEASLGGLCQDTINSNSTRAEFQTNVWMFNLADMSESKHFSSRVISLQCSES